MQSIILLAFALLFPLQTAETPKEEITIEIVNAEKIDFLFSIDLKERRKQILVRSDKAIKSLRLVDGENKKRSFNVTGSNLVILPLSDFKAGQEHIVEVKFLRHESTVLAKVNVPKDYPIHIN